MKKIISILLSIIAIISAVLPVSTVAYAKDPIKTKTISYSDFKTHNDLVGKDGFRYNFTLENEGAVYAEFDLSINEKFVGNSYANKLDGKNGIKFYIISNDGEDAPQIVETADIFLGKNKLTESRLLCVKKALPAGKYTAFAVPNRNNYIAQMMKCKMRLYTNSGFAEQAKLPETAAVKVDAVKKLSLTALAPADTICAASWTTSDKTVAKIVTKDKNFAEIAGVKAGECVITAKLKIGTQYECAVTVTNPAPKISEKTLEIENASAKTLKILYTTKKVTWETSDKKIATVNAKGKATAKGVGECKITAKCGGKKYTCNVKVVKALPDFAATLVEYNKKDNYFVVKFKNYGTKPLTVVSKGAACMADKDSQTRHLYLKGNKNVVIKPGKAKTLKLFVKGKKVTSKIGKIGIMYYFRYGGEKYLAGVWCEDSSYKNGKKWKDTYTWECDMYRIRGLEYEA